MFRNGVTCRQVVRLASYRLSSYAGDERNTMSDDVKQLEDRMEAMSLPESDRDDVRRFTEFLAIRKDKTKITPEMKDWLTGKDAAALASIEPR